MMTHTMVDPDPSLATESDAEKRAQFWQSLRDAQTAAVLSMVEPPDQIKQARHDLRVAIEELAIQRQEVKGVGEEIEVLESILANKPEGKRLASIREWVKRANVNVSEAEGLVRSYALYLYGLDDSSKQVIPGGASIVERKEVIYPKGQSEYVKWAAVHAPTTLKITVDEAAIKKAGQVFGAEELIQVVKEPSVNLASDLSAFLPPDDEVDYDDASDPARQLF